MMTVVFIISAFVGDCIAHPFMSVFTRWKHIVLSLMFVVMVQASSSALTKRGIVSDIAIDIICAQNNFYGRSLCYLINNFVECITWFLVVFVLSILINLYVAYKLIRARFSIYL